MTNALANLDRVSALLEEASTLEDIKKIHDMAEAARTYIKAAHMSRDAQHRAAEIAIRASHKAGKILNELPRAKPKAKGGRNKDSPYWKTINGSGLGYRNAQRWQEIARVQEPALEKYFEAARKADTDISAAGLFRAVKKRHAEGRKVKSRFTHHISLPLTQEEYFCITNWARHSFGNTLQDHQRFLRECLSEFFKETGMALPLEQKGEIQKRLMLWLWQKPISESPMYKEVMKEIGLTQAELDEHARKREEARQAMIEADPLT